jgi:outer membrane protein assembly factor BamD (BamD/ComL family)
MLPLNCMLKWQHKPMWRSLFLFPVLLLNGPLWGQVGEQDPGSLTPGTDSTEKLSAQLRLRWELEGISSAIESGFLAVADTLSSRLLEQPDLPPESYLLSGAYLTFFQGAFEAAEEQLESIDPFALTMEDRAWHRLLEGLILSRKGQTEAAFETLQQAETMAGNELLRNQFEIIRFREELAQGSSDDATISALRESVRSMSGERGGFEAARLLAVALNNAGDTTAAIELLSSQLTAPGLREFNLRPEFLMLLGSIAGSESARGGLALKEIVSSDSPSAQPAIALTMLAQSVATDEDRQALLEAIEGWLEQLPGHALSDRLLAYQSYFLSLEGDFERAEASSLALLERFPNSPYASNALRMLAYTSWNQNPPRYRTAADYLNQLRQRFPNTEDSLEAGILIADCYFLNGDYASASDAYGAILKDASAEMVSGIFYQSILAEIAADRPSSAADLIDEGRVDGRLSEDNLWQAEWNLLDFLRREERVEEAYDRIRSVLEAPSGAAALSSGLALRFKWLDARLTLEAGPPVEAIAKASALIEALDQPEYASLPDSLRTEVESHLLLLQGEAELAAGQKEAGLATFAILRETYPDGGPTILSYLVESRNESSSDNLVNAQQSLVALVDRFPTSEYAPIALWEAALNAEQRGLNIHLQEAIGILERLVTRYPSHELVYYARLKQGDLARRLNDFPTALLLYERLLALFPNHPERYRAELSRADCLMAIGSDDPARFDQATVIYERNCLLPPVPLPIRMEAGFKW